MHVASTWLRFMLSGGWVEVGNPPFCAPLGLHADMRTDLLTDFFLICEGLGNRTLKDEKAPPEFPYPVLSSHYALGNSTKLCIKLQLLRVSIMFKKL